jgi:hypothetical protein
MFDDYRKKSGPGVDAHLRGTSTDRHRIHISYLSPTELNEMQQSHPKYMVSYTTVVLLGGALFVSLRYSSSMGAHPKEREAA